MNESLPGYQVSSATWFYLSLLLIVAVFFRFGRVWSLRNIDLTLLLSLSPCLLLVAEFPEDAFSYSALFFVTGLLLVRLFVDRFFTRRPRLAQNLNVPGLAFLCVSAFAFLMTTVVTNSPPDNTMETVRRGRQLLKMQETPEAPAVPATNDPATTKDGTQADEPKPGPASPLIAAPVGAISKAVSLNSGSPIEQAASSELLAARILAVIAHAAVLAGLFFLGARHFGDAQIGLAMATLYLLLPCTSFDVHKVNHVLPAALIVWALAAYRRPSVSGSLMGMACGTLFFPVFLLPLWAAFYGRRGAVRFVTAVGVVFALMVSSLALISSDMRSFTERTLGSIDWPALKLREAEAAGFWSQHDPAYGIPVFAGFLIMLFVLTVWPRKKSLEQLLASSTAIVVGTQFWYPQQGGVYVLWYLPLLLLVVFRPSVSHLLPPTFSQTETTKQPVTKPQAAAAGASASGSGTRLFR